MSKISSVEYKSTGRKVKVVYSKNVENEMLLMSTCLCKDDLGSSSISRSMCVSTDQVLLENSRVIDEVFMLTYCSENAININYVFYCNLNNIRFVYIPFTYKETNITLYDINDNVIGSIDIPQTIISNKSSIDINRISSLAGYLFVTETDEPLNNFGYRIHEIIENPHRNLRESVLYGSDVDKYKQEKVIMTENGYYKDKRSKAFLATSLETV